MNRTAFSLTLLSASVVAFEIYLMHVFSVLQWSHFASMFISIALLGFGASGTLLAIFRKRMMHEARLLVPLFMIIAGVLMCISIPMSRTDFLLFDSYTLFVDRKQFGRLAANYLLFFLPFFFAGSAIGLIFMKKAACIGRFYFADLLGAGLGGVLAISLMWNIEFDHIPLLISALPVIAGWVHSRKYHWSKMSLTALFLLQLTLFWNEPSEIQASPYKSIRYALQLPQAQIETERHSPFGLVQVVSSPMLRYAPGLSLNYKKQVKAVPVAFKNGNWYSAIPSGELDEKGSFLDHTTMALPYWIRNPESVLQLSAGTGMEVAHALENGARHIEAIEPDQLILDLLSGPYAAQTDSLFYDARTEWHATTARTYVERSGSTYDLIQLPLLGSFGGSVGLNALEEDHVLTVEGLTALWNRLGPNGLISISCWIEQPQNMSLKLAALIKAVLRQEADAVESEHLIAVKSWGTITFLISKRPFNPKELERTEEFCETFQFDLLNLDPSSSYQSKETYNLMENEDYLKNLKTVFSPAKDSLLSAFAFNVGPPSDERPYFFQFLKLRNIPEQRALYGDTKFAFSELGYLILIVTLAQVILSALILIVLPLLKIGWAGSKKTPVALYFAALGLGFMFVEIVLIKYFSLYLEHPIYSISAVISILLISSGIGSRFSERFGLDAAKHKRSLLMISLAALIYALFLGKLLSATIGFSMWGKIALSGILIGLPGFFMGMPFPLGLKKLEFSDPSQIPWAWGINGCVSVISGVLATLLAVELGFTLLCLFGAMAYLLAYLSLRFMSWPG